jgi:hypothetical protein
MRCVLCRSMLRHGLLCNGFLVLLLATNNIPQDLLGLFYASRMCFLWVSGWSWHIFSLTIYHACMKARLIVFS